MDNVAQNLGTTRKIGVLPIDGFAAMSFAALTEPMRAANLLARRTLYKTIVYSVTGHPVQSSGSMLVMPQARVGEGDDLDYLFVIAGGDPAKFNNASVTAWLTRLTRAGVPLGGVSGGPSSWRAPG